MANIFQMTERPKIRRSNFNLSHHVKLSMNMGDLVPVRVQEVIPGDKFHNRTVTQVRFSPTLAPVMHDVELKQYTFYVRTRLIWSEFDQFINGVMAEDEVSVPYVDVNATIRNNTNNLYGLCGLGSLWDYLGLPPVPPPDSFSKKTLNVNVLPFRAYQLIYNSWFRNPLLQSEVEFTTSSGVQLPVQELINILTLRKKNWEKDYFTSATNEPQRGDPIQIPGTGQSGLMGTIENLLLARKLQQMRYGEKISGDRYIDHLLTRWGVRSSDRVQAEPELVCASSQPLFISEVANTAQVIPFDTVDQTPLGQLAGYSNTVSSNHVFKRYFEEDGYLITLACVVPRTSYQDGVPRMFIRRDRFDFVQPELVNIGEQSIKNSEVYAPWLDSNVGYYPDPGNTWGYIPRYSEFKYTPSRVAGDFRDTQDFWHMARKFPTIPGLSGGFVVSDPTTRIFPVINTNHKTLYVQTFHSCKVRRSLPKFSTPRY